jgi:hypothetical protein
LFQKKYAYRGCWNSRFYLKSILGIPAFFGKCALEFQICLAILISTHYNRGCWNSSFFHKPAVVFQLYLENVFWNSRFFGIEGAGIPAFFGYLAWNSRLVFIK